MKTARTLGWFGTDDKYVPWDPADNERFIDWRENRDVRRDGESIASKRRNGASVFWRRDS